MANYEDTIAALSSFRATLFQQQQTESAEMATAFSAPAETPLNNVHATGVGVRIKNGKVVKNDFVLKVFVFKKLNLGNQAPAITSKNFENIGIDVEELPIQRAYATKSASTNNPKSHQKRKRPIVGGLQIAPSGVNFVGTLGCFVRRGNQVYALSNNHVLADTNQLPLGTKIAQPGGSNPNDVFARLSEIEPIKFPSPGYAPRNLLDAAIAEVSNTQLIKLKSIFKISKYTPELAAPKPTMKVTKSGRTTGVTKGLITATHVNGVRVNYGTDSNPLIATFDDSITIRTGTSKPFSNPGDSGSVILEISSGKPVGLLFAGDGTSTTACSMLETCSRFGVLPA